MKNKKWLMLTIGIVVLVLLGLTVNRIMSGRNNAAKRPASARVKTLKPGRQDVRSVLEFNGDVLAIQQANIYSKVGGTLELMRAQIGDRVRTKQLIARIDTAEPATRAGRNAAPATAQPTCVDRTACAAGSNTASGRDAPRSRGPSRAHRAHRSSSRSSCGASCGRIGRLRGTISTGRRQKQSAQIKSDPSRHL